MALIRFLAGSAGRATRVVIGAVLMGLGAWLGGAGWVLFAIGAVMAAAGAADVCFLAPLAHLPLRPGTERS
jgi:predicted phage tail protein